MFIAVQIVNNCMAWQSKLQAATRVSLKQLQKLVVAQDVVAQWVRALAACWVWSPGSMLWEGRTDPVKMPSDFSMCAVEYMNPQETNAEKYPVVASMS